MSERNRRTSTLLPAFTLYNSTKTHFRKYQVETKISPISHFYLVSIIFLVVCTDQLYSSENFQSYTSALREARRIRRRFPFEDEDPNIRFLCKGALNDFTACLCNDADISSIEVACINAQFVDTAVFQHLNTHYLNVRKITFHGNNFQDLPSDTPLFGLANDGTPIVYAELNVLNLSANYIVNLHSESLKATPNIRVLDLSNNEIVLTKENSHFFDHVPKLTHLYLRRAFTAVANRTAQFNLMLEMFQNAKLKYLKLFDLSYNYLNSVPYNLACPFPSISVIDLRQNLLKSLSMNTSCMSTIGYIDLSRNNFQRLDNNFRESFANFLPAETIILRNSFTCDCKSIEYIQWIRSSNTIREKNLLTCARASPANFAGTRLVEVPLHRLDCKTDFEAGSSSGTSCSIFFNLQYLLMFMILLKNVLKINK